MKQVKRIHNICIDATKEDILREFLKSNKETMITPKQFIKSMSIRTLIIAAIVIIVRLLYMLIKCFTTSICNKMEEAIVVVLLTHFFFIVLIFMVLIVFYPIIEMIVEDIDYISTKELISKLKKFRKVSEIVQNEFFLKDNSVEDLLNINHIFTSNRHMLWMHHIINNNVDVRIDSDDELMLVNNSSNASYCTGIYWNNKFKNGHYNLILSIKNDISDILYSDMIYHSTLCRLEKLDIQPVEQFDKCKNDYVYEVIYLSNWSDIGLLMSTYKDNDPAVVQLGNGELYQIDKNESWVRSNKFLTLTEWKRISHDYSSVLTIMERIK